MLRLVNSTMAVAANLQPLTTMGATPLGSTID